MDIVLEKPGSSIGLTYSIYIPETQTNSAETPAQASATRALRSVPAPNVIKSTIKAKN